jgi:hypothetical protein
LVIRSVELEFPLIEGQHTVGNGWAAIFGSKVEGCMTAANMPD